MSGQGGDVSTRREYTMMDDGATQNVGGYYDLLVKDNSVRVWKTSYNDGVTVFRPFPGLDPDVPGAFDKYRLGPEPRNVGDWLRAYPVANAIGDKDPVTFIAHDPLHPQVTDINQLPVNLLYSGVNTAIRNKQEGQGWASLIKGAQNKPAALSQTKTNYFMQGVLAAHKGKPPKKGWQGLGPDDGTICLMLSSQCGRAMIQCIEQVADPTASWTDPERYYVAGDVVSLHTGRFLTFYSLEMGDPRQAAAHRPAGGWNMTGGGGQDVAASTMQEKGYGVYAEPTYDGFSAALSQFEDVVRSKVKPWNSVLRVMSIDEQVELLSTRFPPQLLVYAWADYPHWISETVRNKAVNQAAFISPAAGWPQYSAQPQQAYGQPQQAYGQPPQAYGQPQPTYGQTAPAGFGAAPATPPAGFGQVTGPGGTPHVTVQTPQFEAAVFSPPAGFGAPPQAAPAGFGAPPQAAPAGFGAPPQAAQGSSIPGGFGGVESPPPVASMPTAQDITSGMGQTPGGFTPPPAMQAGQPPQGLPASPPPGMQPVAAGRGAAALAAATQALQ